MKLAVFDVDGTLIRKNTVEDECYLAALAAVFDFQNVSPDWGSYAHVTDSGLALELCTRRLGRAPTPEESAAFRDTYTNLITEGDYIQS